MRYLAFIIALYLAAATLDAYGHGNPDNGHKHADRQKGGR